MAPEAEDKRAARERRRRWVRRLFDVALLLVMANLVLGCWRVLQEVLAPESLRAMVLEAVGPYVRGRIDMGRVRVDPFRGVVIDDATLREGQRADAGVAVSARRIVIVHRLAPLLRGEFVAAKVEVIEPALHLRQDKSGRWNVESLLASKRGREADPFPVLTNGIGVSGATVTVASRAIFGDDRARSFGRWHGRITPSGDGRLHVWQFDIELRDADWGDYDVRGRLDTESLSFEARVESDSLEVSPDWLRRIPQIGAAIADDWQADGKVRANARLSFDPRRSRRWHYDVDLALDDVTAVPRYWPVKVRVLSGRIIVHNDVLYLRDLAGFVKSGEHVARPRVNGFVDLVKQVAIVQLEVQDLALAEEAIKAVPKFGSDIWRDYKPGGKLNGRATVEVSAEPKKALNYTATVDLRSCELLYRYFPVPVRDITARVEVTHKRIRALDLSASLCKGRIDHGRLDVDLEAQPVAYEAKLSMSGIDMAELADHLIENDRLKQVQGVISGELDLRGAGADWTKLQGSGQIELDRANLWQTPTLATVLSVLELASPEAKPAQKGSAVCTIRDGKLLVSKASLVSGHIELAGSGSVNLDGSDLDMTIMTGVDPERFGNIPFLSHAATFVVGSVTRKVSKMRVTGAIDKPIVKTVTFRPILHPVESLTDLLPVGWEPNQPQPPNADEPKKKKGGFRPWRFLEGKEDRAPQPPPP